MKPTDQADATARALDLLDSGDSGNSDPRLLRDPRSAEEARLTRETAAEVWLAVSPLRVAPAVVLPELMDMIRPSAKTVPVRQARLLPWLAVSGWAAAAALAVMLWPSAPAPGSPREKKRLTKTSSSSEIADLSNAASQPALPISRESRIRKEIVRLQERLASVRRERASAMPRVMNLTAPGAVRRTAEESRQRVQSILTDALRSALETESAGLSGPGSLVIERGWLPGGLPVPADGGSIRHRNFPEEAWQELGLLRSADGEYLDASTNTVWSAHPDGKGFFGREITVAEDVTRFSSEPDPAMTRTTRQRTVPEGFIVDNPDDNSAEVVIDQVAPPETGSEHVILVTDSSGKREAIPLTWADPTTVLDTPQEAALSSMDPAASGEGGGQVAAVTGASIISYSHDTRTDAWSVGASNASLGMIVVTLQGMSNFGAFQLVERPLVPNGQPDRIIVEGGP